MQQEEIKQPCDNSRQRMWEVGRLYEKFDEKRMQRQRLSDITSHEIHALKLAIDAYRKATLVYRVGSNAFEEVRAKLREAFS